MFRPTSAILRVGCYRIPSTVFYSAVQSGQMRVMWQLKCNVVKRVEKMDPVARSVASQQGPF